MDLEMKGVKGVVRLRDWEGELVEWSLLGVACRDTPDCLREEDWQWEVVGVPLRVLSCHCRYRVFSASAWLTLLTRNTAWLSLPAL